MQLAGGLGSEISDAAMRMTNKLQRRTLPAGGSLLNALLFDQCPYGSESRKPTHLLCYGADFSELNAHFDHPVRTHYRRDGNSSKATHPLCDELMHKVVMLRSGPLLIQPGLVARSPAFFVEVSAAPLIGRFQENAASILALTIFGSRRLRSTYQGVHDAQQ